MGQVVRALSTVYHHHTLSYAESVASADFPKFSSQEQTAGEDFLLQFNPTQLESMGLLFTCCQDFLLWICFKPDCVNEKFSVKI